MNQQRSASRVRPVSAVAILALVAAAYVAFSPSVFNDGDTGWHLAAGQWILAHGSVPHVDPFSFTMRGHAWIAHEWLAEVIMALVFGCCSWSGLSLLFALAFGATLLLTGLALARALPTRYAILALAAVGAVLAPGALARPHVLAWPIVALWLVILARARAGRRAPPFPAALVMLLWANLHASYIIGLAIAAGFALEAVIEEPDRRKAAFDWAKFGIVALAAAFATPHGIHGFLYPFQVSGMKSLPLIGEWRAARLPDDLAFVLFAVVMATVAAMRFERIGLIRVLLLVGLAGMGLLHARHQAVFALFAAIAILPRAFAPVEDRLWQGRWLWLVTAIAAVLLASVRLALPATTPDTPNWPLRALAAVPPELRSAPVLNDYSFGGPMILLGIAPFIDGRADMYGDAFTFRHEQIVNGDMDAFDSAVRKWKLRWVILHPEQGLTMKLDGATGWRRIYADRKAVIFVRD